MSLTPYKRKDNTPIVAVQMALDFAAFIYNLWGGEQRAKPGDWLVFNPSVDKDPTYTIEAASFESTYAPVEGVAGHYRKRGVWARQATEGGEIATKEGATKYAAGDWLVYNNADGTDGYAMPPENFEKLYEPAQ
jgi:hypothetical protein